ncbi:helix-turn-helix transcriptional regulator [Murinocardiopsis flavida]|nr:WYL domain-containing protein [Murinocardiopsis flavida]
MRAGRLLSLLLLLQNRGRLTAAQLAAELEVSERTVYRDVESLGAAGIPIYADRGTGGGYRLLDGYRTRLTGLTGAEADSLFLAGLPEAAAELGLGAEMAAAHLKLLAALPEGLRERAERVRSRFHLDTTRWFGTTEPAPHLAPLATAVWEQHTLDLTYRRNDGQVVDRTIDPLGLVLKSGAWYFIARVHSSRPGTPYSSTGPRTFRAARIAHLADTGRVFERPAGFDLDTTWAASASQFQAGMRNLRTRVRLTPRGLALVRELSAPLTAADLPPPGTPADPDGRTTAVLHMESVYHAMVEFASYGPDIEVVEPTELRDRLGAYLRAAAERYGAPPGEPGENAPPGNPA